VPSQSPFGVDEIGYFSLVIAEEHRPVTELSIRELLAELTRVEDRLREQAHHVGPHPLPGQVSREAALRRRERSLLAELRSRRDAGPEGQPEPQDELGPGEQATPADSPRREETLGRH
jgi:hypothetical protein